MSSLVSYGGYTGTAYDQSVVWHYKTDMDRSVLNRWYANIFSQGVLVYIPSALALTSVIVAKGTSFIINEKNCFDFTTALADDLKLAKVDMVRDYSMSVAAMPNGVYYLIAIWENAADEYRGVEFSLVAALPTVPPAVGGYYYIVFGQVTVNGGTVANNTTVGQTKAQIASGVMGFSGYSGLSGYSGESGFTGVSGFPGSASSAGDSGWSGYTGVSGYSGNNPGSSGYSGVMGYSGFSGIGLSGFSGRSGFSGTAGFECILVAASDELTPLASGTSKVTFRMPYGFIISKVKGTLTTGGSTLTQVDVNQSGVTVLSTKIQMTGIGIKSNSVTGAGISTTLLSDDAEITIDIDNAGTGATGLKVYLIGNKI